MQHEETWLLEKVTWPSGRVRWRVRNSYFRGPGMVTDYRSERRARRVRARRNARLKTSDPLIESID